MVYKLEELHVYDLSVKLTMDIFSLSRTFPSDEKYSLASQLNRAARSVSLNIAEGWGRRIYPAEFKKSLVYSLGSVEETKSALSFAHLCGFITLEKFDHLRIQYKMVAAQLHKPYNNW